MTAFSALSVLLGAGSVAIGVVGDAPGVDESQTLAAARCVPGLDGLDSQHNETLVRDQP